MNSFRISRFTIGLAAAGKISMGDNLLRAIECAVTVGADHYHEQLIANLARIAEDQNIAIVVVDDSQNQLPSNASDDTFKADVERQLAHLSKVSHLVRYGQSKKYGEAFYIGAPGKKARPRFAQHKQGSFKR